MITITNLTFKLDTDNTSYIMRVLPTGQLEQLHYGRYISGNGVSDALGEKHPVGYANTVAYSQQDVTFCLDQLPTELSGVGKGDFREPAIELTGDDGCFVTDFGYHSHRVTQGHPAIKGLPSAYGDCETLEITLLDPISGCTLLLSYHLFAHCDIITRQTLLTAGDKPVTVRRVMSMQLDLHGSNYRMVTFNGAWAREMQPEEQPLRCGRFVIDAKSGVSSNLHNPFFMIKGSDCTETAGDCWAFNLIYSGNHCQIAEVSPHGRTRLLSGINPHCFAHRLEAGEQFAAPEAVLGYSHNGAGGISRSMHDFVRGHIVRGEWKKMPRPVLVNSWEANYFDIDEDKLVAQAHKAHALGAELYVVDDGWFGKRNNDTTSLGDWFENPSKLPGGLARLAERFASIPMALGLWVEPEMVSVESELYKAHPDWALAVPASHHSMGRNQLVLDLSRDEVCDYMIQRMTAVIGSADISYIKWDMNRNLSDVYSVCAGHNGDLFHRYTLGYYRIMQAVTERFPKVLFEGCAGGGNRFDLGVLCYMPQIWLSDNTDVHCRAAIQRGASYGYPQSVVAAHLSDCPNHQTGRTASLSSRFAVAAMGLLGYELDVTTLGTDDADVVHRQIEFYKQHRLLLQYGTQHRLDIDDDNFTAWITVSGDKSEAIVLLYQQLFVPNTPPPLLRLRGLDPKRSYRINELSSRGEIATASGDLLCYAGLRLGQIVPVDGLSPNALVLPDFGAVLLHLTS